MCLRVVWCGVCGVMGVLYLEFYVLLFKYEVLCFLLLLNVMEFGDEVCL